MSITPHATSPKTITKAIDLWRSMSKMDRMKTGAAILPYMGLPDPLSSWSPEYLASELTWTVLKDDGSLQDWVRPTLSGLGRVSPVREDPESLCILLCRTAAIRWILWAYTEMSEKPASPSPPPKKEVRGNKRGEGEQETVNAAEEDQSGS